MLICRHPEERNASKYMVGAGWCNEKGIIVGSDFSRMNLISNLNMIPRKDLTMDVRYGIVIYGYEYGWRRIGE